MPWISKALKLDPRPRRRNLQSVRWAISFLRPPGFFRGHFRGGREDVLKEGWVVWVFVFMTPPTWGVRGMILFLIFDVKIPTLLWSVKLFFVGADLLWLMEMTLGSYLLKPCFTLKARHIWCPRSPNKRCLTLNTRSWRNKPHRNLIILASEIWPIGKDVHSNLLEHTVHMLEDFMTVQNCSCQLCQIYHVKSKVV